MVDELFTPPPTKKRKQSQAELSPTPRSRCPTKKAKTKQTGAVPGKVKAFKPKNATAGPSRISAPVNTQNNAAQARPLFLDSDSESEFGSDRDPPLGILRKPKAKKVTGQKTSNNRIIPKRKTVKEKVVHIGAIELTDDDDEPPQRAKNIDTSIIDLCSSDDGPDKQKSVQKGTSKKPDISDDGSLIVLSSEDEGKSASKVATSQNTIKRNTIFSFKKKFAPETISALSESHSLGSQKCPKSSVPSTSPILDHAADPSTGLEESLPLPPDTNALAHLESDTIPSIDSSKTARPQSTRRLIRRRQKSETPTCLSVEEVQLTFTKAAEKWNQKPLSLRSRPFFSNLGSPKYERDPREIDFSGNVDPVDLLTPLFFERATLDVTSKLRVARKRAQKIKQALPPNSLAVHDVCTASKIRQEVINSRRFMDILRTKKDPSMNLVIENMSSVPLSPVDDCQTTTCDDPSSVQPPFSSPHTPMLDDHTVDGAHNSATESSTVLAPLNTTPPSPPSLCFKSPIAQALLEVEVSKLTLPSLLETYHNDDSDSDISLSGLEFAYPPE
ncbi:hypothetical protein HYPSUDRAFT_206194 [Hypholoma sublateritium FD-334 SS-4]|uniref:Uncharacterized protein n=1 Tax=Hypholoma sublateritium (strain FD-334 SS-4) TaxID=945553 RepID=A0A0D2NEJ0_HYPSF|nr:hypothetical protein HYPSUDRAFT_206194 [Hypholoma sublateritium FD-334 SS-4]